MGTQLSWAPTVDLLGVRLDRRLSLLPHVRWLAERIGPRILSLRRWTWAYRTVPRWIGVLLFKALIRPAYAYAAPVLQMACPSAREHLRRLERRGLRAALRRGLDYPIAQLYASARVQELDSFLRDSGSQYLVRLAELRSRRLLSAFSSWANQRPDLARQDTLLERLYAGLAPSERSLVRAALTSLRIVPGAADDPPPGRNRGQHPELTRWGISPFEE